MVSGHLHLVGHGMRFTESRNPAHSTHDNESPFTTNDPDRNQRADGHLLVASPMTGTLVVPWGLSFSMD